MWKNSENSVDPLTGRAEGNTEPSLNNIKEGVETMYGATTRKRTGKYVKCTRCGKVVYKAPWELKKHTNQFCSKLCANRFNITSYHKHKPMSTRTKLSKKLKGHPVSAETRRKLSKYAGPNHWNWQGGKQYLPYGPEFTYKLKRQIVKRDGYRCQLCGLHESTLKNKFHKHLTIHHIDYNKNNNNFLNLITLCRACNSRVNYNKSFYKSFFKRVVEDIVRPNGKPLEVGRNDLPTTVNAVGVTKCGWEQIGMGVHNTAGIVRYDVT